MFVTVYNNVFTFSVQIFPSVCFRKSKKIAFRVY